MRADRPPTRPQRRSAALLLLLSLSSVISETAAAGQPVSVEHAGVWPLARVDTRDLPRVSVPVLLLEDAAVRQRHALPLRVGFPMATDLSPSNGGTWEDLPSGDQLWRLKVRSRGALWIALGFGTYRLQPGGKIWVYDPDRRAVQGPFDSSDIRSHGQLWLPPVDGETAVIELFWPAELRASRPNIHLGTVSHGYKAWGGYGNPAVSEAPPPEEPLTLASGSCNIDVNCPLGDAWQLQKQGVARILVGAAGLCSGTLINTTAGDCRPYFLTARHCVNSQSEAASTVFRFNYERPLCDSGEPTTTESLSGSTLLASYFPSDFSLLELDQSPAETSTVYFNGWSHSPAPATESTCIHHPDGDFKKISYNSDSLVDGENFGPTHWRVTEWEQGTTEDGSSGAPLFDQNQRVVGQLHGGTASCTSLTYDEYGKLSVSWDGDGASNQLGVWLDPLLSGVEAIDGIEHDFCLHPRPVLEYVSHEAEELLGNGDGVADPGEALFLRIDVANTGNVTATQVLGQLTTSTAAAGVSGAVAAWPDIAGGEQTASGGPGFNVELDPALACGESVELSLNLSSAEPGADWIAALEIPTGVPTVAGEFSDDMESGSNGWVSQSLLGSESWVQVTSHSASPTHSWYIGSTAFRKVTALLMPPLTALPPGAALRFEHRFDTEANRDGGVLEYSTDGGTSWQDMGGFLVEGGYNSSIASGETTPLAGRDVWSGDSGGWTTVRADLSAFEGQELRLRWRFATNFLVADDGWYLDDVSVDSTTYDCAPLSLAPGEAADPVGTGSAFRIGKQPDGYELDWSAPGDGGAPLSYALYRTPLGTPVSAPQCEAELGNTAPLTLPALTTDSAFVVVARNSLGEGSYGRDSSGQERAPAQGPAICP